MLLQVVVKKVDVKDKVVFDRRDDRGGGDRGGRDGGGGDRRGGGGNRGGGRGRR